MNSQFSSTILINASIVEFRTSLSWLWSSEKTPFIIICCCSWYLKLLGVDGLSFWMLLATILVRSKFEPSTLLSIVCQMLPRSSAFWNYSGSKASMIFPKFMMPAFLQKRSSFWVPCELISCTKSGHMPSGISIVAIAETQRQMSFMKLESCLAMSLLPRLLRSADFILSRVSPSILIQTDLWKSACWQFSILRHE